MGTSHEILWTDVDTWPLPSYRLFYNLPMTWLVLVFQAYPISFWYFSVHILSFIVLLHMVLLLWLIYSVYQLKIFPGYYNEIESRHIFRKLLTYLENTETIRLFNFKWFGEDNLITKKKKSLYLELMKYFLVVISKWSSEKWIPGPWKLEMNAINMQALVTLCSDSR